MTKETFEEIYRQYYPAMYRLARTIVYDADDSRDVVSEVFVRLLRDDIKPQENLIEGYLMTSVRNRCRDMLRHKSLREQLEHLFSEELKQNQVVTINDDDRLEQILHFVKTEFPALTFEIFRLRFIAEMTYEEVATATGVSKVTVYNHLSKTLQRIKAIFKHSLKR